MLLVNNFIMDLEIILQVLSGEKQDLFSVEKEK